MQMNRLLQRTSHLQRRPASSMRTNTLAMGAQRVMARQNLSQKAHCSSRSLMTSGKPNQIKNNLMMHQRATHTQQKRAFSKSAVAHNRVHLLAGKRTPFGKFGESLKNMTPTELSVHCSQALLDSTGIAPSKIDHVIFANVIPSVPSTLYSARHIALKLGCPIETPGYAVNRLCGSGIQAIIDAKNMIIRGEAECVLVTGAENMSMVPHATYGARFGTRYGALKSVDFLIDTLTDEGCKTPMAITAENLAEKFNISRQEVDEFSLNSHLKAAKANEEGLMKDEIAPIAQKKLTVDMDEHIRKDCKIGDMTKLRPAFKENGVVTPATASGVVDGGASVLICSENFSKTSGIDPLATIGDFSVVGVDPTIMGIGPVPAIRKLLSKIGKKIEDIPLYEINEAFAAQALAVAKDLQIDQSKLNIWGGATAIGHPLGATGIRISLTLARQMKQKNANIGISSACIGGGQGIALELRRD